jgi:sulfate transport system permease protein
MPAVHNERQTEPAWMRNLFIGASCRFVGLLILLPVISVFTEAFRKGFSFYLTSISDPLAMSALRLTLITAASRWRQSRLSVCRILAHRQIQLSGPNLLLSLIDLPFAVSPVVSGLVFVLLFGAQGWFGRDGSAIFPATESRSSFATPGVILATIFVTFPFIARELIPADAGAGADEEEAAVLLGASGWQTFRRVTLPNIRWALVYGVVLANARAMGEFGAVSVVSGHIRGAPIRCRCTSRFSTTSTIFRRLSR